MIELKEENSKKVSVDGEIPKEVTLGDTTYLHTSDEEWDYLVKKTDGIEVILQFSKDKEKNKIALEGIRTFFSWL